MRCDSFKKIILLILVLSFALTSVNAVVIGVGGNVYLKDVLRGGFATARVYVSNSNEFPISVSLWNVGETAEWITINPEQPYIIEPGESTYMDVTVQPPIFTPNGVYTGELIFFMDAPEGAASGAGAAISAGASAPVIIEVSDEEVAGLFVNSVLSERTESCRPINLKINLKNIGNVELIPEYKVDLYHKQKGFVKTETITKDTVRPTIERIDTLSLGYTTTGLSKQWEQFVCIPSGEYYANIGLTDRAGNNYYTGQVDIFILEKGAISLSGNLEDLENQEKASLGEPVKVVGKFNNTGDSTEQSRLKLEVYKDDKLVDVINGEETLADPGKVTDIVAYFIPKAIGDFTLKGTVNFGGKFTNVVESNLSVELGIVIILLIVIIPLAILVVLILLWLRKRRGY